MCSSDLPLPPPRRLDSLRLFRRVVAQLTVLPSFVKACVIPGPWRSQLNLSLQWTSFEDQQNDAISTMLGEGIAGDDELQLHQAGPSLHETSVSSLSRLSTY